jgi:hypothetical protein
VFLFDDARQSLSVFATIASIFVHLLDALPDHPETDQNSLRQNLNATFAYLSIRDSQPSHRERLGVPSKSSALNPKAPHIPFYDLSIAEAEALAKRCIESDDKDSD